jgi:dihydrodipicolinate synthase/N-acetylneuraminate lyase
MERNLDKAVPLHRKFTQLCSYITGENEVAFLKATAEIGGQKAGRPRSPYQPLDPKVMKVLEKYLKEFASLK